MGIEWLLHTGWDMLHHLKGTRSSPSPNTHPWAARSATRRRPVVP
ncbi:DUF6010 family protein [Streptomyces lunaelactis]